MEEQTEITTIHVLISDNKFCVTFDPLFGKFETFYLPLSKPICLKDQLIGLLKKYNLKKESIWFNYGIAGDGYLYKYIIEEIEKAIPNE